MPDLLEVIYERRSVRKYLPKDVPRELVNQVLAAAGSAPSAHNVQPYRFIVLADAQVKQELAEVMAQDWAADLTMDGLTVTADKRREKAERFAKAPVLILACIIMDGLQSYPDERRQKSMRDLAVQSLGAALENLLLAAYAAGLGACWYAAPCFCKETVRKKLKIPQAVEPQAFVVLGYAEEKPPVPPKKSLKEYCFVDEWGRAFV
jgi:coenzyme F420-0:L-glutamate ligase/coenzyme F420-1:gamma-L-glutamate ligase